MSGYSVDGLVPESLDVSVSADERAVLATGDEAGTAPEDRGFRPDVEGLRAIAILLVVLFHAGVSWMGGGFVGVDVFFVVSGFVITGLLLRERQATHRTNFLTFYARRVRRILPAGLLVIVVSLVGTDLFVSSHNAMLVASDVRWTALFLGNVHFSHVFPNYLVTRPASPIQHYWSLATEEQFYLVYPAVFFGLLLLAVRRRLSTRGTLAVGLAAVVVVSFAASVITTKAGLLAAYDSPFTRAWELALGGLVAVGAPQLRRIPKVAAALMTWGGLAAILVAATCLTVRDAYPGYLAGLPVVGTALVIGGGTALPTLGVEQVLKLSPFRWIGRWSYSWYLWHWPILVLAAEHARTTVNATAVGRNLVLVAVALALAAGTYFLVENPIRHSRTLISNPGLTIAGGLALIAGCVAFSFAF